MLTAFIIIGGLISGLCILTAYAFCYAGLECAKAQDDLHFSSAWRDLTRL